MESIVDLTFWEVSFIAFKVIPAWVLATASLVLGIPFLIGIGAIVRIAWGYIAEKGGNNE